MLFFISYSKVFKIPTSTEKHFIMRLTKLLSNYTARPFIPDCRDAEAFLKTGIFWVVLANSYNHGIYRVNCEHPGSCQARPEAHCFLGCRTEPQRTRMFVICLCPLVVPSRKIPQARDRKSLQKLKRSEELACLCDDCNAKY